MDWPYRLIALVALLGLVFSALVYGAEELSTLALGDASNAPEQRFRKRVATVSDGKPAQLAFTEGGFSSGRHAIKPTPILDEDDQTLAARIRSTPGAPQDPGEASGSESDGEVQESDEQQDPESEAEEAAEQGDDQGSGLESGLYTTTFDAEDCQYQLISEGEVPFDYIYKPDPYDSTDYQGNRVRDDEITRVIGEDHLHRGRVLVSINGVEPDMFTSSAGCGEWMPWSVLREPLTKATDGDYWGGDLAQGEWSVPPGCIWEKVTAFRGGRLDDVVDSNLGPGSVMIDEGNFGLRVRQCQGQSMIRIGEAPPYVPYEYPGPGEEVSGE